REKDHTHTQASLVHCAEDSNSVHDGQAEIEYDDVRSTVEDRTVEDRGGGFATRLAACHHGDIVCVSEEVLQGAEERRVIIEEHDADRHAVRSWTTEVPEFGTAGGRPLRAQARSDERQWTSRRCRAACTEGYVALDRAVCQDRALRSRGDRTR